MLKIFARKNLRRCRRCRKPGHNQARCNEMSEPSISNSKTGIIPRLYFGSPTEAPLQSPHIVNLKTNHPNIWSHVQGISPTGSTTPRYHYYHKLVTASATSTTKFSPKPAKLIAPLVSNTTIAKIQKAYQRVIRVPHNFFVHLDNSKSSIPTKKIIKEVPFQKPNRSTIQKKFSSVLTHLTTSKKLIQSSLHNFQLHLRTTFSGPKRLGMALAVLAFIFIFPFSAKSYYTNVKSSAEQVGEESVAGLKSLSVAARALKTTNLDEARTANEKALHHFALATAALASKHMVLREIVGTLPVVGTDLGSAEHLILAGEKIALGNSYLLKSATQNEASSTLGTRIDNALGAVSSALPNYEAALHDLKQIDLNIIPISYQESFSNLVGLFDQILGDLKHVATLEKPFREIFGVAGHRRYLVIFQNQHEIRPTGGFMGSFAILDIKDGKIEKLDVPAGGSYDLQGQLDTYIEPPAPLLLSNKRWEFQDANWFPDFPTTAEKILWFYRHSRGVTADGVIAINGTVLERLLAITGPITHKGRGITLTAENALPTLQNIVETGPEKSEHKPKQILSDFAPQLLSFLTAPSSKTLLPLGTQMVEALERKEIQIYLTDQSAETDLKNMGWGGSILPTQRTQDYLLVVNTNLQGGKSDAAITQDISHQAAISPDGTITNTVTITRSHRGKNDSGLYGHTNIDFMRVYVPKGSTLVSASGFTWPPEKSFRAPDVWSKKDEMLLTTEKEIGFDQTSGTRITEEFDKFTFGNWVITEPGGISQVQFTYQLPFKAFSMEDSASNQTFTQIFNSKKKTSQYQLAVQRQSGADTNFSSQIVYPTTWQTLWSEGPHKEAATNGMAITSAPLEYDTAWSLLMEQN